MLVLLLCAVSASSAHTVYHFNVLYFLLLFFPPLSHSFQFHLASPPIRKPPHLCRPGLPPAPQPSPTSPSQPRAAQSPRRYCTKPIHYFNQWLQNIKTSNCDLMYSTLQGRVKLARWLTHTAYMERRTVTQL